MDKKGINIKNGVRITAFLFVIGVSVWFGASWIGKYKQKSKATAAPPLISMSIPGAQVAAGQNFGLYVAINPNSSPFYSFNLVFKYDAVKVDLANEANPTGNIEILDKTIITQLVADTINHTITIKGTRTTSPFIGGEPIQIVKVSLVMRPSAALPLTFTWDSATAISEQTSSVKEDLIYTGPTPTPQSVTVPTSTLSTNGLTSTPVPSVTPVTASGTGGALQANVGTTTSITQQNDRLYINSIVANPAPFRYEQSMQLQKGAYTLRVGAKVVVNKGRGMLLLLICNSVTCGGSTKSGDVIMQTPTFPQKSGFSEMTQTVTVAQDSNFILRLFCEDGSECDVDYVSLEDPWGSERVTNAQFSQVQMYTDTRKQPTYWQVDTTANLYGSVDLSAGTNGALVINNSAQ